MVCCLDRNKPVVAGIAEAAVPGGKEVLISGKSSRVSAEAKIGLPLRVDVAKRAGHKGLALWVANGL